jgi:predicted acyl esterase
MDRTSPGLGYAIGRIRQLIFPRVSVTKPVDMVFERDLPVRMPDGITLRVNVFRPRQPGRYPVVMSAHPYSKDGLPKRVPWGYIPAKQYRVIRQPGRVKFSAYTGWEAPDPSYWVPRGYVVVNLDVRGFGTSEGVGSLLSEQEASDYAEVIEWAAQQPWSNGKVGLNGVSYLAISQWRVAARQPAHLAAICPWEGWTDVYHDVAFPGGVRETGFMPFWAAMVEAAGRTSDSFLHELSTRPDWDDYWRSKTPELEAITTPALICASFSDQGLHTRGSFEAFRRISSKHRYLYTHRAGKWATYYSPEALEVQTRFFEHFLKGVDNGMDTAPPVRLEVRSHAAKVYEVRSIAAWPPPDTKPMTLYLVPDGLRERPPTEPASAQFTAPDGGLTFAYRFSRDLQIIGPMTLKLSVDLEAAETHLFVAVRKFSNGRHVPFEGSFGFGRDAVTKGWQRIARPDPGQTASVTVELLPSATYFAQGDTVRLDVQSKWFWRRNPLFGVYPGDYEPSPPGTVTLRTGPDHPAYLVVSTYLGGRQ